MMFCRRRYQIEAWFQTPFRRKTDGGDIFRPLSQAEFHQPPKPEKCPKESLNEGFALEIGRDWGTIDVFLKIEPFNLKPLAPDKHFRQ